ncbi:MAG: DUF4837 family protein [Bacteroidota bacterium]
MRSILTILCLALLLSCENKEGNQRYLSSSSGNINTISVVIDNILWEGKVGEKIRSTLAMPLEGLPQDEPIFTLRQIPTQVFDGFVTKNRIILKVEKTDENSISVLKEVYAKPQTVVLIKGITDGDIIDQLENNVAKIIDAFNKEEVKEKLRRINKSLLQDEAMESALGFSIDIPSAYRIAKSEDNFYWVRKSLSNTETMDLMFYSIPMETIKKGDSTIIDITKVRDSITKQYIPGPEDGKYMTTEDAYVPSLFQTIVDNKPAYETRGIWEVNGMYMAGPFVNYAIEDKVNNRYLVAEGYVYAPRLDKRKYVFELEAIIKSIRLN